MKDKANDFFKDLWERRFFQLLATYIGVSWGILQFLQFAIERYDWNSSIIDKFLLFVVVLLPGVALFIYNHGRAGHDSWKSYEKILLPINLVAAIAISTLFSPQSVKATESVKTITIETDQDSVITRAVPKLQYTNRIVLFPFESQTEIEDSDWLKLATPLVLSLDLEQDMRLFTISPFSLKSEFDNYNKDMSEEVDLGTMVKIARDNYSDYFVTGEVRQKENLYSINVVLYGSEDGKEIIQMSFNGENFYPLIDEATSFLNGMLYNKEIFEASDYLDLPAKSLISDNWESLKSFVNAAHATMFDLDLVKAEELVDQSLEADSDCVECYRLKSQLAYANKKGEAAKTFIEEGLRKSSGLPERQKLAMRLQKYQIDVDMEKSLKLMETWSQLYPSDFNPVAQLMAFYNATNNYKKGIKIGEQAKKNGHEGSVYTSLANMYNAIGETEKAKENLQLFADRYPHKAKENSQLGDIYLKSGELDKALALFEKLNIYRPEDQGIVRKIADIHKRKGNSKKAFDILDQGLSDSNLAADSFNIYRSFGEIYQNLGQIDEGFKNFDKMEKVSRSIMPKMVFDAQFALQNFLLYNAIDSMDAYKKDMYDRFSSGAPTDAMLRDFVDLIYASSIKDLETYKTAYQKTEAMSIGTMGEAYKYSGMATRAHLEGNHEDAYKYFVMYKDSTTIQPELMILSAGNIYLEANKEKEFVELLDQALDSYPMNASFLFKKAKALIQMGEKKEAKLILEKAMAIWQDADDDLAEKLEAEELLLNL